MTDRDVERLTLTHTEMIEGRVVVADPLIEQLRRARYSSVGYGGTRGAASGSVLNTKAFDLYEEIDGTTRAWLDHYRQHHRGDLADAIVRLAGILRAEVAGGRLDPDDPRTGMFGVMVYRIENMLDPPHEKELTFPCPDCGERYHDESSTELRAGRYVEMVTRQAALRILVRPGRALVAECHCCGKLWATVDDLVGLGEAAGCEVNFGELIRSGAGGRGD